MKPQFPSNAGFTLLEVLIAVAILGLVMAGITQGVRYGLRAWAAEDRVVGSYESFDAADRSLRFLIGRSGGPKPSRSTPFKGSADQVEFVTDAPASAAVLSRRIDALIEVDSGGLMVLRWRPHAHETRLGPVPVPERVVLLDHVGKLELSFHLPAIEKDAAASANWRASLPETAPCDLVRIRIRFAANDPRQWPDIVVARNSD